MKEKENKIELTDEYLLELFKEGIEWFQPKMVDVLNKKGEVIGEKDIHFKHIFLNDFFIGKNLYRQKLNTLFNQRPWVKEKYDELLEVQEYKLANLAAFKDIDSSITKFILSNKHDWKEKSESKDTLEFKDFDLKNLVSFKTKKDKKK